MPNPSAAIPPPLVPGKTPAWKISPAGGKYYINSVAVSADGGRVLGGTYYHRYGAQEARHAPAAPPPPADPGTAPSPEDGLFGVYCYDARGIPLWKDEFQGWQGVYWVGLSADGTRAAAGGLLQQISPQGFVRIYDAADQGRILLSHPTQQRVNQVALSGDGTWIVSAAESLILFRRNPNPGTPPYVLSDVYSPGNNDGIVSTAISDDGLTVVYADYNGYIGVFANEAGKLVLRARWKVPGTGKGDFCHMIDLAPDGKAFAAGGAAGVFYYFDVAAFVATGQPTGHYATGVAGAVYGVAVAESGGVYAGIVNNGEAGTAYLVLPAGGAAPPQIIASPVARNPNGAALNATYGLLAVADGHPDGTPGHFYLYNLIQTGARPVLVLRWMFQTGNMSWPIAISARGNAVVGGSDDSCIYFFTP